MTWLALDTETALVAPFREAPPLACVSASMGGHSLLWHNADADLRWNVSSALQNGIVGHGVAFDMAVLVAHDPMLWPEVINAYEQDRILCTVVRQKLLDIKSGVYRGFWYDKSRPVKVEYSLEALAYRHFGTSLDKTTHRLRYGELIHVPLAQWPEGAISYAKDDAVITEQLLYAQEAEAHTGVFADQFRQTRHAFWLKLMSIWGLRTWQEGVERVARETDQELRLIEADLRRAGLIRPDRKVKRRATKIVETVKGSRNTKVAQELIVAAYVMQGRDYPRTDTGAPSLDKVACEESGNPLLANYAKYTSLQKMLSNDIPLLERGVCEPIHSNFETLLVTGRTSSSPNVQNVKRGFMLPKGGEYGPGKQMYRRHKDDGDWLLVPAGVRECFRPSRPDWCYVAGDFSGLELCTLAQICLDLFGYSSLAEALNGGIDPHSVIGAQIMGMSYEAFLIVLKDSAHPLHDAAGNARQTGKVVNFGCPGGLGIEALVFYAKNNYGVELTPEEADHLRKLWRRTWAEMNDYFRYINDTINLTNGVVVQPRSGRIRGNCTYTAACNTGFQGLGSDVAKHAGWLNMRACYYDVNSPLYGYRPVNFVHDELINEGPRETCHEAAEALGALMLEAARIWIPNVKIKVEPYATNQWSKHAKQVRKEGKIAVWEG